MAYAPPVSRNNFFYGHGGIYVEVERHRHTRASSFRLYSLLTYVKPDGPVLTKKGQVAKRQPTPHRDEPAHFYTAQLIHHGLKSYKSKDAAKKHILAAFDRTNQTISVPNHILQLEGELKEEWERNNNVAETKYQEEKEKQRNAEVDARKKAREEYDSFMKDTPDNDGDNVNDAMSREELVNRVVSLPKEDLRRLLFDLIEDEQVEQVLQDLIDDIPPPQNSSSNGKDLKSEDFKGEFKVLCPYLSENYSTNFSQSFTLRLVPSSTEAHLWGSFDFGIIKGIIRSTTRPPKTTGSTIKLFWRGRETGEGEMTYGKSNLISLTFLGGRRIKGKIKGSLFDNSSFAGTNVIKKNVVWVKYLKGWKSEWRGYNADAYEAERVGRWGTWYGGRVKPDKPADSDTSGGDKQSKDESEDDDSDESM